jgi:hypothetical protein
MGVVAMSGFAHWGVVTVTDPAANGQSGVVIGLLLAITLAIAGFSTRPWACGLLAFSPWGWSADRVRGDAQRRLGALPPLDPLWESNTLPPYLMQHDGGAQPQADQAAISSSETRMASVKRW